MKAAVLFEYPVLNGGEHSYLAKLPFLQAAGIDVVAVAPGAGPLANRLRTLSVPVVPIRFVDRSGQRQPQASIREQLTAILQQIEPDVVHANSLSMSRLLGPVAASLAVPSIGHIRDIVRLSKQAVSDLNQLDRVLAVSSAARDWHVAGGLNPSIVQVQWNGIDLSRFHPSPPTCYLHGELEVASHVRFVATIGQIGMRKGTDLFLEAATELANSVEDVHWVIVGERNSGKSEAIEFERRLWAVSKRIPLQGRVHFLGRRGDIPALLNEVTLVVHSARQEPLGRILLESAACGCAIVATDVGGTTEIFPPSSKAAAIVQKEDSAAISRECSRFLANPERISSFGELARNRIIQEFDVAIRGPELAKHYFDLVNVSKLRHDS